MTLSETLRKEIQESGLSLSRISKESGVARASISRFVSGKSSLRLDVAQRLARYLGLLAVRKEVH